MIYKFRNITILLILILSFVYLLIKDNFKQAIPIDISYLNKTYLVGVPKNIYKIYDSLTLEYFNKKINKCFIDNSSDIENGYKFFVAGHVYGKPGTKELGIYKKFYKIILNKKKYDFGIFTGDIVKESTNKNWEKVEKEIKKLNFPIYFVVGNHDVGIGYNDNKRKIFQDKFGETIKTFFHQNDLFIILDTNFINWKITNNQINLVEKILSNKSYKFKNVFIFTHQIIWFNQNGFSRVSINSSEGLESEQTNYWNVFEPLLQKYDYNYYLIAGDTGARHNNRELFCKKHNDITYIASGMGNGKKDNYLVIESYDNNIKISPIFF